MAMIKCPECGQEISDKAKKCSNCGCPVKNKGKLKWIIIIIVVIMIIIAGSIVCVILQNNEKYQQKIETINKNIQKISNGEIPSQEEYNELVAEIDSLSENEKQGIKDSNVLDKFKGIDLDRISNISKEINVLDESNKFYELLEIQQEYEELNSDERQYIDISKLESLMELTDIENAALTACKNVQSCMISRDSFKVKKIMVKDDITNMKFYWVVINYSGTNSFGAELDKTSCFGIGADFVDSFFGLAQITGYNEYLDSPTSYNEYTKCTEPEIEVDVDKIEYYLNK